ncbi:MAG: DUF222 domain-containing protein, partial [Mycobacteriales bacterium]
MEAARVADPADPAAPLGRLAEDVSALLEAALWGCSDADVVEMLAGVEVQARRLYAVSVRLLGEVSQRGCAGDFGATSTAGVLRGRVNVSPADATARDRAADVLLPRRTPCGEVAPPALPQAAAALARGAIGAGHVQVIVDALRRLPAGVDDATRQRAGQWLTEQARIHDPMILRNLARHLREALDPDGAAPADLSHRRKLSWHTDRDGLTTGRLCLDPEGAETVRAALDPLMSPAPAATGGRDLRTVGQRRGDALVELARRALADGGLPTNGGAARRSWSPWAWTTCVTAAGPAATTPAARSTRRRRGGSGATLGSSPPSCPEGSVPLDVGRAAYTVPPSLRRALILRDRGCSFPGCDRPAAWCEAHHVRHWVDGGETALPNLVL